MINSKSIALFFTLNAAERRRFKKWLASPIHNSNHLLSKFYDFLETRSEWTALTLRRERAYTYLFGESAFEDVKLRRILSDFYTQLEQFIVYENTQNEGIKNAITLSKQLRARQLPIAAKDNIHAAQASILSQKEKDAQFHLNAYWIQEEQLTQNPSRDVVLNLQEVTNELTYFFVAEMLRNACIAFSHKAIFKTDYNLPYLENILSDCAAGKYDHIQVIRLYHHIARCLSEPKAEKDFEALKALLPTLSAWLHPTEVRNVFLHCINYGIRRLNQEGPSFIPEVFILYKMGLKEGIFIEHQLISRFTYKNIVAAALALGEYEWTTAFIRDFSTFLDPLYRKSYESFCTAKLLYLTEHKEEAQSILIHLDSDDIFLSLDTRVLLLKIYFDMAAWRLLNGFLNSFEHFVKRKKQLSYHAPNYLNIIHFTGRLAQHYDGKKVLTLEELAHLETQILASKPLTEREWLLQQLHAVQTKLIDN
jgi:hypothetical protein